MLPVSARMAFAAHLFLGAIALPATAFAQAPAPSATPPVTPPAAVAQPAEPGRPAPSPTPAVAVTPATPLEGAIRALVAAIDGSPQWAAEFSDIEIVGADGAVLNGLVIASQPAGGFSTAFGPIRITGYAEEAGGFRIALAEVPNIDIKGNDIDVAIGAVAFENLAMPDYAVTFDPARPFTSMVKAYALIGQATVDRISLQTLLMRQFVSGLTTSVTYDNMVVTNVGNGIIESMDTGRITMSAPMPGAVVSYTIDGVKTRGFNINTLVHVFDPDRYAGGRGDLEWRTALAEGSYENLRVTVPGASVALGRFYVEDIKLRQPESSFAPLLDAVTADPDMPSRQMDELVQKHMLDLLSAVGLGRLGITGFDITASGIDRFHVGDFHIDDLSIAGLGEFGVSDVDVVVGGEVSLQLERFAFGGLRFPAERLIREAVALLAAGDEPNPLPLIPLLGFVEAAGLRVAEPGKPPLSLDNASLKLDGYVGPIPTAINFTIDGLTVPTDLADRELSSFLVELGYDVFTIDEGIDIFWREETETVEVNDLHFDIADVGSFSADFGLQGVSRAAIENPDRLEQTLEEVLFTGATVRVQDASLARRLFELLARRNNVTPERYREQIAGAVPFFLTMLQNAGFQGRIAPAIQQFIREPGTLVIRATPVNPVPFSTILSTAQRSPQRLPDLLEIEVLAE